MGNFEPGEDQIGDMKVAAFGKHVYVVWNGVLSGDMYLRASHDGGSTFTPIINLRNNPNPPIVGDEDHYYHISSESPEVAVSGNNVYVTWITYGPGPQVMFAASNNRGNSFDEPLALGSVYPSSISLPRLAADGRDVYVVWGGLGDALFRASHDKGQTFESIISLNEESGLVYFPQVISNNGRVHVSWLVEHSFQTYDVFVKISKDHGATFGPPILALDDVGDAQLVFTTSVRHIFVIVGGLEVIFAHS